MMERKVGQTRDYHQIITLLCCIADDCTVHTFERKRVDSELFSSVCSGHSQVFIDSFIFGLECLFLRKVLRQNTFCQRFGLCRKINNKFCSAQLFRTLKSCQVMLDSQTKLLLQHTVHRSRIEHRAERMWGLLQILMVIMHGGAVDRIFNVFFENTGPPKVGCIQLYSSNCLMHPFFLQWMFILAVLQGSPVLRRTCWQFDNDISWHQFVVCRIIPVAPIPHHTLEYGTF